MPDALELPGMLCPVIPLVGGQRLAGFVRCVVDELVALGLWWACRRFARRRSRLMPGLAAVIGALNDLSEPAGSLRRVKPIRVSGRHFHVVNLPAREVGSGDIPFFP